MKNIIILIITISISIAQSFAATTPANTADDPPSYTAPNGKTYTWGENFAQLSVDYSLDQLVDMPVWICCGNTSFQELPKSCRKGIVNSGVKPHQVQNLSPNKTYVNSLGNSFTPDPDRLRLYGFCMVESDSRGIIQTVDIDKVCEELRQQMLKEGVEPCNDLTPQNVFPDYDKQLIYYTVCGKTYSKPMTDNFRPATTPKVVKEVVKVDCVDDFVNLPVLKICEGESYEWNIDGTSYTYDEPGTYLHSTPKADNCGKVNTILNLDFYEPRDTTLVPGNKFDFAAGESFSFQDITLTEPGTYKKAYTDSNGCQALATIVLQEKEMPVQKCSDCVTNARDLGNIEVAARLNYGRQPVAPASQPINHLGWSGGIEAGFWKDWRSQKALENPADCRNNLFEYGIIGGLASQKLYGGESSECDCNDASQGSAIHAYVEPGIRWHLLGMCDRSKILPLPVVGTGLRLHYNDHKLEDISKLSLSPKLFAEGRWYFSKLLKTQRYLNVSDTERDEFSSPFFSIGVETFAPGFTFNELNTVGYVKLGLRF